MRSPRPAADAWPASRRRRSTRALRLEPNHLKGLWLAASLDLEERRYTAALARWQQLRAALPAGSPDAAIIDANIDEARQLAGQLAQAAPPG